MVHKKRMMAVMRFLHIQKSHTIFIFLLPFQIVPPCMQEREPVTDTARFRSGIGKCRARNGL